MEFTFEALQNESFGEPDPRTIGSDPESFFNGALYHKVRESCLDVKRGGFRFRIHCP